MPPQSSRRCSYHNGKRRCQRNGTGNPPLCRTCREALGGGEPSNPIADVLGKLFTGKPVTSDDVSAAASAAARAVFGQPVGIPMPQPPRVGTYPWIFSNPPGPAPYPPPPGARRPPRQPPPPDREAERDAEASRAAARVVLGIGPRVKLTKAMLDKLRRDLARKHHPDRGGSTEKMKQINSAVDILLATVDN